MRKVALKVDKKKALTVESCYWQGAMRTDRHKRVLRGAGIIILQLIVTAAGVTYVFHDANKRTQIAQALRDADWRWIAAGLICYSFVEMLATLRWQMLLRVQGIRLGWMRSAAIVIIGLFFNLFLPGLVGGDAMRLYFVFKQARQKKTRATLSVAIDRWLGLVSILCLALVVTLLRFRWLSSFPQTAHITYLALGLLAGVTLLILALFLLVTNGYMPLKSHRWPFQRIVNDTRKALQLYHNNLTTIAAGLGLTIISHLAYYSSFYCASRALHGAQQHGPGIGDILSIMPLVNTITGVPISFGGVGVRETLFQTLLGRLADVPAALAALTASLGFAMQASWGLVGGVAYLILGRIAAREER